MKCLTASSTGWWKSLNLILFLLHDCQHWMYNTKKQVDIDDSSQQTSETMYFLCFSCNVVDFHLRFYEITPICNLGNKNS